jgi:hypothetical protein
VHIDAGRASRILHTLVTTPAHVPDFGGAGVHARFPARSHGTGVWRWRGSPAARVPRKPRGLAKRHRLGNELVTAQIVGVRVARARWVIQFIDGVPGLRPVELEHGEAGTLGFRAGHQYGALIAASFRSDSTTGSTIPPAYTATSGVSSRKRSRATTMRLRA